MKKIFLATLFFTGAILVSAQKDKTASAGVKTIKDYAVVHNQPLYILDGKPVSSEKFNKIDPNTIESVNVLKNASATAIYGDRGKYGVIIIETKSL